MVCRCSIKDRIFKNGDECNSYNHGGDTKTLFWGIVVGIIIIALLIWALNIYVNSPEYIKEQQEWENMKKWGCSEIKSKIDEITTIRAIDRTNYQDRVLDYLVERVPWECDANLAVIGEP